jgi:hypothetical protein
MSPCVVGNGAEAKLGKHPPVDQAEGVVGLSTLCHSVRPDDERARALVTESNLRRGSRRRRQPCEPGSSVEFVALEPPGFDSAVATLRLSS